MSAAKPLKAASRRSRLPPRRGRRIADAALGALSGALVGVGGVALMAPYPPPAFVTIGMLAAVGAASGYRWGRQVHAALWDLLFKAMGQRGG